MSYDLKGTPVPHHLLDSSLRPTFEERKGLLSDFDTEDRDGTELPRYEDEEYVKPQERAPLRKRRITRIAGSIVALVIGVSFLAPMLRIWCCGIGTTSRPMDPSGLLSNGTHNFKRTVLIVSFDGLR